MNIIDRFRSITTCADCCKGVVKDNDQHRDLVWCACRPIAYSWEALHRCDSGLWLATVMDVWGDGKRITVLVALETYLNDMLTEELPRWEQMTIIPRAEWPKDGQNDA